VRNSGKPGGELSSNPFFSSDTLRKILSYQIFTSGTFGRVSNLHFWGGTAENPTGNYPATRFLVPTPSKNSSQPNFYSQRPKQGAGSAFPVRNSGIAAEEVPDLNFR